MTMGMSKHSCVVVTLSFLLLYSMLWLSQMSINESYYLIRDQDVIFINCFSPDFQNHQACLDPYPSFEAHKTLSLATGVNANSCWSGFDYIKGISRYPTSQKSNVKDLLDPDCKDYIVRSFVDVRDTSKLLQSSCSSCSVVFSSGRLLDSDLGGDIDSGQCVIRLNNAPTRGFERDVGSRTTHRIVSHNALYDIQHGPHILSVVPEDEVGKIIIWDPPMSGKLSITGKVPAVDIFELSSKLARLRPNMAVYYGRSEYFDNVWLEETGTHSNALANTTWISTGFYAFVIAMGICDNITVFGLLPENHCLESSRWAPYHYYPPGVRKIEGLSDCHFFTQHQRLTKNHHVYLKEQTLFRDWAARLRNIHFASVR